MVGVGVRNGVGVGVREGAGTCAFAWELSKTTTHRVIVFIIRVIMTVPRSELPDYFNLLSSKFCENGARIQILNDQRF